MNSQFTLQDILIDPSANIIIKNSKTKRVEPQVMKLICYLAERPLEVISKQALIDHIWPDSVVGNEALTRLIFLLRNLLGDDAKHPCFIETIPKKGYRLLVSPEFAPLTNAHKLPIIYVLLSLAAVLFLSFFFLNTHDSFENKEIDQISAITHSSGIERHFNVNAYTGDILYVHLDKNDSQIELKSSQSNEIKRLTNDESRKRQPLWLDENTLVYIRGAEQKYQLVRLALGGNEEVIYQSPNFIFSIKVFDHNILILEEANFPTEETKQIIHLSLVTAQQTNLSQSNDAIPSLITAFAYEKTTNRLFISDDASTIHIIQLNDNSSNLIKTNFTRVNHIVTLSQYELLLTGNKSNQSGSWVFNTKTQESTLIHSSSGGETITQAELVNNELFFSTSLYDTDIGRYGTSTQENFDILSINTHFDEVLPVFSNANKDILFFSNRTGGNELWQYSEESSKVKKITSINAKRVYRLVISQDNKYAAISFMKGGYQLAVIDIEQQEVVKSIATQRVNFPLAFTHNNAAIYVSEYDDAITLRKLNLHDLTFEVIAKNSGLAAFDNALSQTIDYVDYDRQGVISKNKNNNIKTLTPLNNLHRKNVGQLKITPTHIHTVENVGQFAQLVSIERGSNKVVSAERLTNNYIVTDISNDGKSALFHQRTPRGPQGGIYKITYK